MCGERFKENADIRGSFSSFQCVGMQGKLFPPPDTYFLLFLLYLETVGSGERRPQKKKKWPVDFKKPPELP